MKVHELIEILTDLDPDADVYLMTQQQWPFEVTLEGVAVRGDFTDPDPECEPLDPSADRWGAPEASLPMNDVFFVGGGQIRYGSQFAWDALRE